MSKPKAIVTRRWPTANEERLKEHFDVTFNESDVPFTSDQLKDALKNCDVFMPTVTDKVTRDVLSVEGRTANMIANFGVGFNHIDIEAAKELGITVSNTPSVLTDCTADIAMSLLLMVARRVGQGERELRSENWGYSIDTNAIIIDPDTVDMPAVIKINNSFSLILDKYGLTRRGAST